MMLLLCRFTTEDTRRHFIMAWHAEARRKKAGPAFLNHVNPVILSEI